MHADPQALLRLYAEVETLGQQALHLQGE
jgi:hypothetical protein